MANIPSISVKHKDRYIARMLFVGPDEEGAERLSVWSWDEQLFEVRDAKLQGSWDIGASIGWEASGIDDFAALISGAQEVKLRSYFCLK